MKNMQTEAMTYYKLIFGGTLKKSNYRTQQIKFKQVTYFLLFCTVYSCVDLEAVELLQLSHCSGKQGKVSPLFWCLIQSEIGMQPLFFPEDMLSTATYGPCFIYPQTLKNLSNPSVNQ